MRKVAMAFMGLLAVAACGSNPGNSSYTPASSAPSSAPSPTPAPITVTLNSVGSSGASGTAEIVKAAGGFTLTLTLKGLAPNSSHVDHIHDGSCQATGKIAIPLQTLTADAYGTATATTTISQEFTVPATGWYVNVHAGPDLQGADAKAIACGNVPAS